MEEAKDDNSDNTMPNPKSSMFVKLQPLTSQQSPSVLSRMEKDKISKPFVFRWLKGDKYPKPLVFARIKIGGKPSSPPFAQERDSVCSYPSEINNIQKLHCFTYEVYFFLRHKDWDHQVKRCPLVITGCETSSISKKESRRRNNSLLTMSQCKRLKIWMLI